LKRIEELQIENFKFFTGKDNNLKFGTKNILIWGENGSGKSSIYWAIYTLFQCCYKDSKGIDDYFTEKGEKNLINIYADPGAPSFIRMKLDDGVDYKIALGDHSIIGNEEIEFAAVSSDFISYQMLLSFLSFYHSDKPEFFNLFEEEIFRYLPFKSPAPYELAYFDKAWETVSNGLVKPTSSKKYPSKNSTSYNHYKALVDTFNLQLKELLGQVTIRANKILKTEFEYDIEIELDYSPFKFQLNRLSTEQELIRPEIELKIKSYYGKTDVVKKPHSFLNEAKKTAIGLAIRLGILERRLLDNTKLNLLALDDLLVSLDMSNREVVLNLLFKEYQKNYQLLLFTHDKEFYFTAKNKIEHSADKGNWNFWEFYVDEREANILKPRIFENETELSIAYNHLLNNDYPAAANYLRKDCERIIEKYLPQSCFADPDKKDSNKNHPLDSVLTKSSKFLSSINQVPTVHKIFEVQRYVKMLLNPLSHTERGVEPYKGEIKKIIILLDELENLLMPIKYKRILPMDEKLSLNLTKSASVIFKILIKTNEDLYVYLDGGNLKLSKCLTDSLSYRELKNGVLKNSGDYRYFQNMELELSYSSITDHPSIQVPKIADWQALYSDRDNRTLRQLMVL
jgi:hypothetical protein